MADPTEELTPVLVPFEKAATYNQFKAQNKDYDLDTLYNMSNDPNQHERTRGYAKQMIQEIKDNDQKYGGHFKGVIDKAENDSKMAEYWKQHTGADHPVQTTPEPVNRVPQSQHPSYSDGSTSNAPTAAATSTSTATKQKKKHKDWRDKRDWSDSSVDLAGGVAMGANTAGSIAGGLATAGDATRKMMQGVLNPGLMGQGAAEGMLGAVDTMVTPTKESRARQNNLVDAAQLTTNRKELMDQIKAIQNNNELKATMEEQAKLMFQNTQWSSMYDNPNLLPSQYKTFINDYQNNLSALVQYWRNQGMPEELIKDVAKAYYSPLEIAMYNNEYTTVTEPTNEKRQKTADNEADVATANAAAINNVATNIQSNFAQIKNNPKLGFASGYLDWALKNGYATRDIPSGQIIPKDKDLFIDGQGNTIDSPNFNANTAKVNYGANGSTLNDFISYLKSTGDPNNLKWAAKLGADKMKYDDEEKKFREMPVSQYYEDNFKRSIGRSKLSKNNNAKKDLRKTQATVESRIFERYGASLGLSAEQVRSLANNGGLASTSIDDYDALKKVHGALVQDRNSRKVLDSIAKINEKIGNAMNNNQAVQLTDAERELYREELIYQNLCYRLAAMEKIRELDNNLSSFGRRFDAVGNKPVDEQGYPVHLSQIDTLHRFRDMAYAELKKGLYALNDDMDEIYMATYDPAHRSAGGMMVNGNNMAFQKFGNTPSTSQAWHLANMVVTDHNFAKKWGSLGDPALAGTEVWGPGYVGSNPDRRVHYRLDKFMSFINNAADILGGPHITNDNNFANPTLSEEGMINKAGTNQIIQKMGNMMGTGPGSASNIVSGLSTPKNTTGSFIDPYVISRYGNGEFFSDPPTSQDIASIKQMRDSLDNLHNATNSSGYPVYSDTQSAAMKQYRAELVTNTAAAYIRDHITNGIPMQPVIDAYRAYTGSTATNNNVVREIESIINSQLFASISTALRLGKENDPTVEGYLGKNYDDYMGAPGVNTGGTSVGPNQLRRNPQKVLGLMNALFDVMV